MKKNYLLSSLKNSSTKIRGSSLIRRCFSGFTPHVLLPVKVIKFIESKWTQALGYFFLVFVFYMFSFEFVFVFPIILIHFIFSVLTIFFYYIGKRKKNSRFTLFLPYFLKIYLFLAAIFYFLVESWLRFFLVFSYLLFYVLIFLTGWDIIEVRNLILPLKIVSFLDAVGEDSIILENHFNSNIPLIKGMRSANLVLAVFLAFLAIFSKLKHFCGISNEMLLYLVGVLILSLVYVHGYRLYLIWCTNKWPTHPVFISFTGGIASVFSLSLVQLGLMVNPETAEMSYAPRSVKYVDANYRGVPVAVDAFDRRLLPMLAILEKKYGTIDWGKCLDPEYPFRRDMRAVLAAEAASLKGASSEDIKAILYRNYDLALKNPMFNYSKAQLIITDIPERKDLDISEEEINARVIARARANLKIGAEQLIKTELPKGFFDKSIPKP